MASSSSSSSLTLFVGSKNYSSWSFRPWLCLRHSGLAFNEEMVEGITGRGRNEAFFSFSPSGLVPVLRDEASSVTVWDSLAICEYVAELAPPGRVWPVDAAARAYARSACAEMHSGFVELRSSHTMNIKMNLVGKPLEKKVAEHVERITTIFETARARWGEAATGAAAGPYLFGAFSAADAFYAPVICRFITYNISLEGSKRASEYMAAMLKDEHFAAWRADALKETLVLAHYDALSVETGGAPRA